MYCRCWVSPSSTHTGCVWVSVLVLCTLLLKHNAGVNMIIYCVSRCVRLCRTILCRWRILCLSCMTLSSWDRDRKSCHFLGSSAASWEIRVTFCEILLHFCTQNKHCSVVWWEKSVSCDATLSVSDLIFLHHSLRSSRHLSVVGAFYDS